MIGLLLTVTIAIVWQYAPRFEGLRTSVRHRLEQLPLCMRVVFILLPLSFVSCVAFVTYYVCIQQSDAGSTLKVLSIGEAYLELLEPILLTSMVMLASAGALILTRPLPFRLILIIIELGPPSCFIYALSCHLKSVAVSVAAWKIPAFLFITLDAAPVYSVFLITVSAYVLARLDL